MMVPMPTMEKKTPFKMMPRVAGHSAFLAIRLQLTLNGSVNHTPTLRCTKPAGVRPQKPVRKQMMAFSLETFAWVSDIRNQPASQQMQFF